MSDPTDIIALRRCADMRRTPVPASGRVLCNGCGEECWIAQTSVDLVCERPELRLLCTHCCEQLFEAGAISEVRPVPGSLEEMRSARR